VTKVKTPDGSADVTTEYYLDGAIKKLTATNPGGHDVVTTYSYNNRRLLTAETQTNGTLPEPLIPYTLSYGYSANGYLSAIGYPDGEQVTYSPDALGRATLIAGNSDTYASAITYYPNGAIKSFNYGAAGAGGPTHTMTQNTQQLPWRSLDKRCPPANPNCASPIVILDDTYRYDANGNVTDITDAAQSGAASQTRGMAYDGLDRLTTAVGPWGNGLYSYDALDNLRTADQGARKYRYTYDPATFRLSKIKDPAGADLHTFDYDDSGDMTRKNGQVLVFDKANRLSQVTGSQTYRYDGLGRRVQTTDADGKMTYWVYSQAGQVLFTYDARRSRNLAYIYLGNTQVATRAMASGLPPTVRYQMTDALGSPVADTDLTASSINRTSYSPWGESTPSVDGTGYTGHVMDAGTGFTYMQQRYYDPAVGRFLSVDPLGSGSNLYGYAANNPFGRVDPDGRQDIKARSYSSDACGVSGCNSGSFTASTPDYEGARRYARRMTQAFADRYNQGDPNWHDFGSLSEMCNLSIPGCLETAQDLNYSEMIPGMVEDASPGRHSLNGSPFVAVPCPWCDKKNPIVNTRLSRGLGVNTTLPGHDFHPGQVISFTFAHHGYAWNYIRGIGTTPNKGRDMTVLGLWAPTTQLKVKFVLLQILADPGSP
jgi:RHS repeat-associated protein